MGIGVGVYRNREGMKDGVLYLLYCRVRMLDVFGITSDLKALALTPCPKPYTDTPLSASGNNIPNAEGPTM